MDTIVAYAAVLQQSVNTYTSWWVEQYETNPTHVIVETLLIAFILYVYFKRPAPKKSKLSASEMEELIDEWEPEPLVPPSGGDPAGENGTDISTDFMVVEGRQGSLVSIQGLGELVDMASFDFLGFATDESIKNECIEVLKTYGCGSCGPRGFYGTVDLHLELENAIAKFFGVDER